jgi:hypothetical protein
VFALERDYSSTYLPVVLVSIHAYSGVAGFITDYVTDGCIFVLSIDSTAASECSFTPACQADRLHHKHVVPRTPRSYLQDM